MTLDDPDVRAAIADVFPLIPWALDRMQAEISPLLFGDLEQRVKASVLHNLVMREGQRRLSGDGDVTYVESRGLMHFSSGDVLVRVKLANARSMDITNNATYQTKQWTYQQLPLGLVRDPRLHLHLVYIPDNIWTKINRSVVGIYQGTEIQFYREIDIDEWYGASGAPIDPFAPDTRPSPLKLKPGLVNEPFEFIDENN